MSNALNYLYDFINRQLPLAPQERENWKQISHLYLKEQENREVYKQKGKNKMNTVTNTLTDLPKTLEDTKLQNFTKEIVRYQNFRTTAAFNAGVSYIKNNKIQVFLRQRITKNV